MEEWKGRNLVFKSKEVWDASDPTAEILFSESFFFVVV